MIRIIGLLLLLLCGGGGRAFILPIIRSRRSYPRVTSSGPLKYILDENLPDALTTTTMTTTRNTTISFPKTDETTRLLLKALADNFVFDSINDSSKLELVNAMQIQEFKEGDWIMRQGEVGDCFYIVAEGEVAFHVRGESIAADNSNVTILNNNLPPSRLVMADTGTRGASFGELSLLYDTPCTASIQAMTPSVKLYRLDQQTFQLYQRNRRPRGKRSFLHELDRFLTELQGVTNHLLHHKFLSGNFAPVSKEHVSVPVEVMEGQIPTNLNGAFLRNGPNPITGMQKKRYHWFDGHAMLHTLMVKNGKASYTNQFVPSPRFSIERELGEEYFPTIGEYKGILGLMKLTFHAQMVKEKIEDLMTVAPPNTNIMMYRGKLYCLHEACLPMEVRMHPDGRLDFIGYETFDGVLDYPVSAHPVIDGDDLLFHSYSVDEALIKEHGTMKVGRYNSKTAAVDNYLVPTPTKSHVSFAHSLTHTDNYIIVWDCSVHFKTDALFLGGSFFRNNQDYTMKFGLIPKHAKTRDEVIWIDAGESGAIVHPLHAWEEEVVCSEDGKARTVIKLWTPVCKDLDLDLQKSNTFHMTEYTIDPNTKSVTAVVIDDTINSEFANMPPPLKESPDGGPKRIGSNLSIHDHYGFTAIFGDQGEFIGYAKWDMVSRCLDSTVYYAANEVGGEPMIVRAKSDDGGEEEVVYVGSYVYNEDEDQSYFLLFDGDTNKQVCRLKMPSRVPFGFHGQFISDEQFVSHFDYHEARERNISNNQCPIQWIRFFIRDFVLGRSVHKR